MASAAHQGIGVFFSYGNYAGDVLNFNEAQDRLRAEGVQCRTVTVTDDISSAPVEERIKRRGIAGDLVVFKVAATAAEAGNALEDVARVASLANERTRSFGVAFSGCMLPGARDPLFTVPAGRMAVGMGIHGEPGIGEREMPTANELAELLVASLLEERPHDASCSANTRVVVVLNGLGSIKYEELFVIYSRVWQLLQDSGLTIVEPEVGELVTSFDMAGVSLTLLWLTPELEELWHAPADAPAFRKGALVAVADAPVVQQTQTAKVELVIPEASSESRTFAAKVLTVIDAIAAVLTANAAELGRIDAVAGDGDHGIGMQRGSKAAAVAAHEAAGDGAGAGTVLKTAADAWADRAGGTSGALWGIALRAVAEKVGDKDAPTPRAIATGVAAARDGVIHFGKAAVGDKTMVDVLVPFSETLERLVLGGDPLENAWREATAVAETAASATSRLLPKIGRARPHAERSLGTPDAGAVSLALIVRTVNDVIASTVSDRAEEERRARHE